MLLRCPGVPWLLPFLFILLGCIAPLHMAITQQIIALKETTNVTMDHAVLHVKLLQARKL